MSLLNSILLSVFGLGIWLGLQTYRKEVINIIPVWYIAHWAFSYFIMSYMHLILHCVVMKYFIYLPRSRWNNVIGSNTGMTCSVAHHIMNFLGWDRSFFTCKEIFPSVLSSWSGFSFNQMTSELRYTRSFVALHFDLSRHSKNNTKKIVFVLWWLKANHTCGSFTLHNLV